MCELHFLESALYSITKYFTRLFSWDKELVDEETPSTWENAKNNNKTLSDALQALSDAGVEFLEAFKAFAILAKDLFPSEKIVKPRMKFAPCLKVGNGYNYIPVAKRNMPYQRRRY